MSISKHLQKVKDTHTIDQLNRWSTEFRTKKMEIFKSLVDKGLSREEIADAFLYSNMKENYPDFCPLYKLGETCHNLPEDKLCCYGCDCPHFDLSGSPYAKSTRIYVGLCQAYSKMVNYRPYGKPGINVPFFILDCKKCTVPHKMGIAKKLIMNAEV